MELRRSVGTTLKAATLVVAAVTAVYWFGADRWTAAIPPTTESAVIVASDGMAILLLNQTTPQPGTPRLDLRFASAADQPVTVYGMGRRIGGMDMSFVERRVSVVRSATYQMQRERHQALVLAGDGNGRSDWEVDDLLLVETYLGDDPYSTILLGPPEDLLDHDGNAIPIFGPARNRFAPEEVNIASTVPPGEDVIVRISVLGIDGSGSSTDLYLIVRDGPQL